MSQCSRLENRDRVGGPCVGISGQRIVRSNPLLELGQLRQPRRKDRVPRIPLECLALASTCAQFGVLLRETSRPSRAWPTPPCGRRFVVRPTSPKFDPASAALPFV